MPGQCTCPVNEMYPTESLISPFCQDKQEKERQDAKNNLEEYVYEMRGKCSEEYEKFVKEEEREKFVRMLDATEDWLYDEGEDQSRGVYVAKLTELKKIGQPIVDR